MTKNVKVNEDVFLYKAIKYYIYVCLYVCVYTFKFYFYCSYQLSVNFKLYHYY